MARVNSIMTRNPACCFEDTPLQDVAQMMIDNDCGLIPVVDVHRHLVGVVTDRDIATRIIASGIDASKTRATDAMSFPVRTVGENSALSECVQMMEDAQVRRVPVVDASGSVCGIVSLADIALAGSSKATVEVVKEVSQPTHA